MRVERKAVAVGTTVAMWNQGRLDPSSTVLVDFVNAERATHHSLKLCPFVRRDDGLESAIDFENADASANRHWSPGAIGRLPLREAAASRERASTNRSLAPASRIGAGLPHHANRISRAARMLVAIEKTEGGCPAPLETSAQHWR
jgi:hypothetical protein